MKGDTLKQTSILGIYVRFRGGKQILNSKLLNTTEPWVWIRQQDIPNLSELCFFGCVGPIHYKTCLREAYASLRGVKSRGGVLFGVAYAGGYARIILSANLKKSALKQLWLLSRYLASCGFISFYFGFLWLHFLSFWPFVASLCLPQKCLVCVAKGSMAASFIPPKTWGTYGWGYQSLTRGLRGGYAALTRGELVASDKRNSQLQGHQMPQKSQSLIYLKISYEKIRLRKFAYAMIYHPRIRKVLTPLTQPWEFSGIALTRSFYSSLFFIALSFQKKRCSSGSFQSGSDLWE